MSLDCLAGAGERARAPKWLCIWDGERGRRRGEEPGHSSGSGSGLSAGLGAGPGLCDRMRLVRLTLGWAAWAALSSLAQLVASVLQPARPET